MMIMKNILIQETNMKLNRNKVKTKICGERAINCTPNSFCACVGVCACERTPFLKRPGSVACIDASPGKNIIWKIIDEQYEKCRPKNRSLP